MPGIEIQAFSDEHLDAAGGLLAARHRRHRRAEPLLPERFEDPDAARAEAEAAWRSEGASGAVAVTGGRLVGYLIGAPRDDALWGANIWVELAGHAVEEPEVVRDLYAAAARRWTDEGRTRHYTLVPAADSEHVDAWFRVSFGQQHAFGIRGLAETAWPRTDGVTVREAESGDVDALLALGPLISDHQALSPVFGRGPQPPNEAEDRAEIEEDIASPTSGSLVAEADGRIVGTFLVVPVERSAQHTGLARPDGASLLAWAATVPEARGTGAGVALTDASFAWAHRNGYETMVTDWRVTNLLSSRFWPKRGFRTTFLRLYRSIP